MEIITNEFYILKAVEQCLFMKSFHSWDMRVMGDWIKDITPLIERHWANEDYVFYVDCEDWNLSTPDVDDAANGIGRVFPYMPKHCIHVVGDSYIKPWQIKRAWSGLDMTELYIVKTHEEAMAWLKEKEYKMPSLEELVAS